jgi:hypothetical protein
MPKKPSIELQRRENGSIEELDSYVEAIDEWASQSDLPDRGELTEILAKLWIEASQEGADSVTRALQKWLDEREGIE